MHQLRTPFAILFAPRGSSKTFGTGGSSARGNFPRRSCHRSFRRSCFLNARAENSAPRSAAIFDAIAADAARARPSCRARVDARFRESGSRRGDVVPGSTRTKVTRALTKAICGNLGPRREPAISVSFRALYGRPVVKCRDHVAL